MSTIPETRDDRPEYTEAEEARFGDLGHDLSRVVADPDAPLDQPIVDRVGRDAVEFLRRIDAQEVTIAHGARLAEHPVPADDEPDEAHEAAWRATYAAGRQEAIEIIGCAAIDLMGFTGDATGYEGATVDREWGAYYQHLRRVVWALALRDLITEGGPFTRAHYDALTGPWRAVVGPVHPDDPAVPGT